jgi:hypothetical protein
MRRGEQVPDGWVDETVTRVLRAEDTLETEEAAEELILVAETVELEAAFEVEETTAELEAALELLGTTAELDAGLVEEGAAELGDPPEEVGQTRAMLLSCHVTVVDEKPDQTRPVMAFPLAPEKAVNGKVMVWELPLKPVTWV